MPTKKRTFRQFMDDNKLVARVTSGPALRKGWSELHTHWKVAFFRSGNSRHTMIVTYSQGPTGGRPDPATVLRCVAQDCAGYENAGSLEGWAAEYGEEGAERSYNAVYRQVVALRRLLGDGQYEALLWETEDEP